MEAPLARSPVFSHSSSRALYDHERNITGDQVRAMGARGGYVGIGRDDLPGVLGGNYLPLAP